MSWGFKRTSLDKNALKLACRQKLANSNAGGHFPSHGDVATAIDSALDALPNNEGIRYRVETSGHIGDRSGDVSIKVQTAPAEEIVS